MIEMETNFVCYTLDNIKVKEILEKGTVDINNITDDNEQKFIVRIINKDWVIMSLEEWETHSILIRKGAFMKMLRFFKLL